MVTLWNPADDSQDSAFTLFFSGGQYVLPIHLEGRSIPLTVHVRVLSATAVVQGKEIQRKHFPKENELAQDGTVLERLIQPAGNQNVPIGMVNRDNEALCETKQSRNYAQARVSLIIDELLSQSGYTWRLKDGVLQMPPERATGHGSPRPPDQTATFGGINTMIQGLGVILAGYVRAAIFPGEGYAGNILAPADAEKIPPFTLRDVTVKQAADSHRISRKQGCVDPFSQSPELRIVT